jgi:hypothetical protein
MDKDLIFSLIGTVVSLGGLCVFFGMIRQKIIENGKDNEEQAALINDRATKDDLAKAIRRSDELLELLRKREDEDRSRSQEGYNKPQDMISAHSQRITALETSQDQIFKSLTELKNDMKNDFSDIKEELKDLRSMLTNGKDR